MKKVNIGKIDISTLNTPPEKHEYETARYFANRGLDVRFIGPHHIEGLHNPDFEMRGLIWETKSPILYSKSSFENNLKTAMKQSENIIYDLRRLKEQDEYNYIQELRKRCTTYKIKILLIITRDGRLFTIKGKFDIM